MRSRNMVKRSLAGVLAVLCVAAYAPANVGGGGIFGGTAIVAAAESGKALPYSYGFEDNNLSADGWVLYGANFYSSGMTKIRNEFWRSGSYCFCFDYRETKAYLISPELTGGESGVDVSFWYKAHDSSYPDHFKVGYTTDPTATDPSAFTYGDEIIATTTWTEYKNTFPAGTAKVAIQYVYNKGNGYYLYLDDFSFSIPTGAANVNINSTSNGTVTADKETAADGETVTLTVTPDEGYELENLSVTTTEGGEPVTVTDNQFIMPAMGVTVSATFKDVTVEEVKAFVSSASITLDGSIGLNLYVDLGTQTADKIVFNGPTGVKTVPLDNSTKVTSGAKAGCYKVTYPVYAKDMNEAVTFTLYNGESVVALYNTAGTVEFNSYSVNTYLEAASAAPDMPVALSNLITSMADYGKAAENLFSGGTNVIEPAVVGASELESYRMSTTGDPNGFVLKSFSLLLESETTLRLYYTGDINDEISVTCGSETIAFTTGENARGKYIQIPNIAAHNIDNMYTISIGDYSVNVGAYSYMLVALSNADYVAANPDLAKALYAMYDYNQKADAYFASLN